MNPYDESDDDLVRTYGRVHANGEQTHLAILSCGEAGYVAVAYDVRPADYTPVDGEAVAYDPTLEGVVQRADRWLEANPKGVAPGDGGDGGGSRVVGALMSAGKRLNDYGNQVAEQQQDEEKLQ